MDELAVGQVSIPAQGTAGVPQGIRVRGARRTFGALAAVDHMDLDAPPGVITALVGPAGAGKTTLLMMLATLLRPDNGDFRVAGHDPVRSPGQVRARMGWMPDSFGPHDTLTAREVLEFVAAAHRFSRTERAVRAAELLEWVRLPEYADRPIRVLSRSQKQRLNLARAIVHRPSVVLLDEPAAGLDGPSCSELGRSLRELAASGCAILVTARTAAEVVGLADRVTRVVAGRTVALHAADDRQGVDAAGPQVAAASVRAWRIRALEGARLVTALRGYGIQHEPAAGTGPGTGVQVMLEGDADAADLVAALVRDGVRVVEVQPAAPVPVAASR